MTQKRFTGIVVLFMLSWITAGCASVEPPTGTVSQAELAVSEASESDAQQFAAQELGSAQINLDAAKRAMDAENYVDARRLAEKALVDAQLAEAKAESQRQRRAASELSESIETLRQETNRSAIQ